MPSSRQINSGQLSTRRAWMMPFCVAVVLASLSLLARSVHAQEDLTVTASFNSQTSLVPNTPIEFRLSRSLKADETRIAVIIGRADVTSLFIIDGARLVYSPSLVALPLGESPVVVYVVKTDSAWRELGRFQLHVIKEALAPAPDRKSVV